MSKHAEIPMRNVGPIRIKGAVEGDISVPLATLETPLWFSVGRGAKVSLQSGGINTTILDSRMTRSIILEAPDSSKALAAARNIAGSKEELQKVVAESSHIAQLLDINWQIAANLIYLRLEFFTVLHFQNDFYLIIVQISEILKIKVCI